MLITVLQQVKWRYFIKIRWCFYTGIEFELIFCTSLIRSSQAISRRVFTSDYAPSCASPALPFIKDRCLSDAFIKTVAAASSRPSTSSKYVS